MSFVEVPCKSTQSPPERPPVKSRGQKRSVEVPTPRREIDSGIIPVDERPKPFRSLGGICKY